MIEVYIALSLVSLGYLFNYSKPVSSTSKHYIEPNALPSQTSIHGSTHTETVHKIEKANAQHLYQQAQQKDPKLVISKNHVLEKSDKGVRLMSGKTISPSDFVHSNMVPFFKGSTPTQSIDPEANQSRLEAFTGISKNYKPKHETETFFEMEKDVGNVNGSAHNVDFMQDRVVASAIHNNVLPFKQVLVGPGMGLGYNDNPTGGFQQYEVQDYAKPKNVDELRTKTNPKVTYEGRVLEGQKGQMLGKVGKVRKNRVERVYQQTPDMYLKTTGAYLKAKKHPKYVAKITNRQDTTQSYRGGAFDKSKQNLVHGEYRDANKQQLHSLNKGHANLDSIGRGTKFDYGLKSIQVYANERDTTTTRTYEGNLTTVVKAMIAPIQDIFRTTKKEHMADHEREFGNMHTQIPEKPPVHDPNDVARTTIKETTLAESQTMNLKGTNKSVVYDPNNIARTTIKETTLTEAEKLNLKGPVRAYVYDPNEIARTTTKETTLSEAQMMNLYGTKKGFVYDPNDVARTTIKESTLTEAELMNFIGSAKGYVHDPNDIARTTINETTLHEADVGNLYTGRNAGQMYDSDDEARITLRQTLEDFDTNINLTGHAKQYVYDPDDVARTTTKETLIDHDYIGGVDGFVKNVGEYRDNNYQLKETHKQYLTDHEYIGHVDACVDGTGYMVAPTDVKNTTRQTTSDNDYYGTAKNQNEFKQMSYDSVYNADIDDSKEIILSGRDPVKEGKKVNVGSDNLCVQNKKTELNLDVIQNHQFTKQKSHVTANNNIDGVTKTRNTYKPSDRFETSLYRPKNALVHSIV